MIQASILDALQGVVDFFIGVVEVIVMIFNHVTSFFQTLGSIIGVVVTFVSSLPVIVQVFIGSMVAFLILSIVLSLTRDYL